MVYNRWNFYFGQGQLYGINKHVLFILIGALINIVSIFLVVSIKAEPTIEVLKSVPVQDFLLNALQCISFLYIAHYAIKFFDRIFSKKPNAFIRYFAEVGLVLIAGFCVVQLVTSLYIRYFIHFEITAEVIKDVNRSRIIFVDFQLLVYGFMRGFHFFSFLKKKEIELIKWQKDISQSNFEALKNQLNPHFLFNSFSVLISLIYVDPLKADQFIGRLSRAYRYLLDQRDKERIPLSAELEFLKNFEYILSQRFGRKIQISAADFSGETAFVIPYTLILIIEHLIAGNKMSDSNPLTVSILPNNGQLHIRHSYSPKSNPKVNEQLLVLQERYEQLSGKAIEISRSGDFQLISIPLLAH